MTVLFAPAPDAHASRVRIASSAGGQPDAFVLGGPIDPLAAGDWRNYPRAAAAELTGGPDGGRGIDALVVSDLPMAAGLSSSSALVVGVGLALARAGGAEIDRLDFAGRMARAERFVGTSGGGMDQAACLLSRAGCVTRIAFAPPRVDHLPFPSDLAVLVADSGEPASKSGAVRDAYNERRASAAGALEVVAAKLGASGASFPDLAAEYDVDTLLAAAESALPAGPASGADRRIARFRHVVTEAGRVRAAEAALREGDGGALGDLLAASHASLRDDCEVSTPALDRLVEAALEAGALGARLTGAGFGGAILALARSGDAGRIRDALARVAGPERVLTVRPSDGAEVRAV